MDASADPNSLSSNETIATTTTAVSLSNAISRLHKQFVGRGPTVTRTTVDRDLVVCLLEGGLTTAELTLTDSHQDDLVAAGRHGLQESMRDAVVAAVQDITGRRVHSFMSATDLATDLQAEIFVLASEPSP